MTDKAVERIINKKSSQKEKIVIESISNRKVLTKITNTVIIRDQAAFNSENPISLIYSQP